MTYTLVNSFMCRKLHIFVGRNREEDMVMSLCKLSVVLETLLGMFVACATILLGVEIATAQPVTPPETPGGSEVVTVVPLTARILVGQTEQFRVTGQPGAYTWTITDSSGEGIGTIDENGLFTAQTGGWVIIGIEDEEPQNVSHMGRLTSDLPGGDVCQILFLVR